MRAEILSIGTELLLGQITDTNAVFLAQRLAELGIPLYFKATVGDNPERLLAVLRLALRRSDLIVCTGGLGPTEDDITTAGIAAAFDVPVERYDDVVDGLRAFFARLNRPLSDNQLKQADFPRGATLIPNPTGTAPGFILEHDGKTAIVLPGPPQEMQPMWQATVAPYLRARSGAMIVSRTLRFCGIGEGALEMRLRPVIHARTNPTVAPYAKLGEVHIRVTARAATPEEARALIAPVEAEIRAITGEYIYGTDDETLEEVVGRLLREAGLTLAVAESCTGGLLGGRITNVPGSSAYFRGGVIAYDNVVKTALLGVPPDTLATHGAVSEATARAMASGVTRATGADLGISITGIAGPDGGTPDKPVGLTYIGVARRDAEPRADRHDLWGDRPTIRARAVQNALITLRNVLAGKV